MKKTKKQKLPRMEQNTLHLKTPIDMGEGEIITTIEFDQEMTSIAMNMMKADPSTMTNADVLVVASKLCAQSPHFLLNRLSVADKRFVVDYTLFLLLVAA